MRTESRESDTQIDLPSRDPLVARLMEHRTSVRRTIEGLVASDEVEDVYQEVCLKAIKHNGFRDMRPESAASWLRIVATTTSLDEIDRRRRYAKRLLRAAQAGIFAGEFDPGEGLEAIAVRREMAAALAEALARLTPRDRALVILRYFDGLTIGEIAEILQADRGRIGKRIKWILDQLRVELNDRRPPSTARKTPQRSA